MLPAEKESPPEVFVDLLEERSAVFGLSLSNSVVKVLARFLAELDVARRRTNLTGPLKSVELVDHTLESVLGERLIVHDARVVDIGAGAGFPGIPLAAARPDLRVTELEPRSKRGEFLRHVISALSLENCVVLEGRAEKLVPGLWNVATARAVGSIERVLGQASFLEPGGLFLAWTTDAQGLARRLGGRFEYQREISVPESRRKVIAAFRKRNVPRGTRKDG